MKPVKKAKPKTAKVKKAKIKQPESTPALAALIRAAEVARRTAKFHGTPLYFWENGKVIAVDP